MNGFTLQETAAVFGETTFAMLDPRGVQCGWLTVRDDFVPVLLREAWNHKVVRMAGKPMKRKRR